MTYIRFLKINKAMKIDKRLILLFEQSQNMVNELTRFCSKMNTKYYVNEGGCIWLAYIIAQYLEEKQINYNVIKYYDEYDELFHISLVVFGQIINPATDTYNGYTKAETITSKELKNENTKNEDTRSFLWKQKYKDEIIKEFNSIKELFNNNNI